ILQCSHVHPASHSFPTRRSSDLPSVSVNAAAGTWAAARMAASGTCFTIYDVAAGPGTRYGQTTTAANCTGTWAAANTSSLSWTRSEEHTSELQSRVDIVCRLLLE